MLDPLMTSDMQNIAEAFIGDHSRIGPLILQDGVGCGRGRVEDEVNLVGAVLSRREEVLDAPHDAVRGILRRGRNLVDSHRAGIEIGENEVGKRAADIDADDLHGLRTPNVERHVLLTDIQQCDERHRRGSVWLRDESQVDDAAIGASSRLPRAKPLPSLRSNASLRNARASDRAAGCACSRHDVCFVRVVVGASPTAIPPRSSGFCNGDLKWRTVYRFGTPPSWAWQPADLWRPRRTRMIYRISRSKLSRSQRSPSSLRPVLRSTPKPA